MVSREHQIESGCWFDIPYIRDRMNLKISGHRDIHWVEYTLGTFFGNRTPLANCLSLGCGSGALERELARHHAFTHCRGTDISESAITSARLLAQQSGIAGLEYVVEDANIAILNPESFDAVWAMDSVHHFGDLGHVFRQVAKSLRKEGLFILYEYVGPDRFQFSQRQKDLIQSCYQLLPAAYRTMTDCARSDSSDQNESPHQTQLKTCLVKNSMHISKRVIDKIIDRDLGPALNRWLIKQKARRQGVPISMPKKPLPTVRDVISQDPSEAIHSSSIVMTLRKYFHLIDVKPLGGSILQFLLADIGQNFIDDGGRQLLDMLCSIEDTLLSLNEIESDFMYIVASPR